MQTILFIAGALFLGAVAGAVAYRLVHFRKIKEAKETADKVLRSAKEDLSHKRNSSCSSAQFG